MNASVRLLRRRVAHRVGGAALAVIVGLTVGAIPSRLVQHRHPHGDRTHTHAHTVGVGEGADHHHPHSHGHAVEHDSHHHDHGSGMHRHAAALHDAAQGPRHATDHHHGHDDDGIDRPADPDDRPSLTAADGGDPLHSHDLRWVSGPVALAAAPRSLGILPDQPHRRAERVPAARGRAAHRPRGPPFPFQAVDI